MIRMSDSYLSDRENRRMQKLTNTIRETCHMIGGYKNDNLGMGPAC